MKQLKKRTLTTLSKSELEQRSSKRLLGGRNCCICGCSYSIATGSNAVSLAASNNSAGIWDAGYGTGAFA